jgi:hypothetical protein
MYKHKVVKKVEKIKKVKNRRRFLPFFSSILFLPFIGKAKALGDLVDEPDQYQTLLTKDGKIVKVRSKTVNDSKIIDNDLSNRSLLKWLKKNSIDI